jgi:hypothetical protein
VPIPAGECPYTGPYSIKGEGKHKGPTAEALKRAMKRAQFGFSNKKLDDLTQDYNDALEKALDKWDPGKDGYGEGRWKKILGLRCPAEAPHAGEYALDEYAQRLIRDESIIAVVPDLGAVFSAGQSVLFHDLTHRTSGLAPDGTGKYWPAFDDAFRTGTVIVAPEKIEVYQASSSNPGDACYARGVSKLRWWFGHLVEAPSVGTVIPKGKRIGTVCKNSIGGGPHVHVALNVEEYWGKGRYLAHHTNYSHGATPIGKKLAAAA